MWVFQQPGGVRVIRGAIWVTQDARHQAADRVDQCQRGQFAAGEDKIAGGKFLVGDFVDDPPVDAFVMAAQQREVFLVCQPRRVFLRERLPLRA